MAGLTLKLQSGPGPLPSQGYDLCVSASLRELTPVFLRAFVHSCETIRARRKRESESGTARHESATKSAFWAVEKSCRYGDTASNFGTEIAIFNVCANLTCRKKPPSFKGLAKSACRRSV